MKIIYTKEEVENVMQKHYFDTHISPEDRRPIEEMVLSPNQVTIELGPVPEPEKDD